MLNRTKDDWYNLFYHSIPLPEQDAVLIPYPIEYSQYWDIKPANVFSVDNNLTSKNVSHYGKKIYVHDADSKELTDAINFIETFKQVIK